VDQKPVEELGFETYAAAMAVKFNGLYATIEQVIPHMKQRSKGVLLVTGGAAGLKSVFNGKMSSVGVANASSRILTMTLANQCLEKNVHVATVQICGQVAAAGAGGIFDPLNVAKVYSKIALEQDKSKWQPEYFVVAPQAEGFFSIPVKNFSL